MQNGTMIAITLELEVAGDTLAGKATSDDGESVSFAGWLGLVSAIDALLAGTAACATADPITEGEMP